jgi:hypothetical protein
LFVVAIYQGENKLSFHTLVKYTNFKKGLIITRDYLQKKKTQDRQILYMPACVLYCIGSELDQPG